MSSFLEKYLKYKNKYLKLKVQIAGRNVNIYSKSDSQIKYQVDLEPEDDIYTLKNQVVIKDGPDTLTVDDIDVYSFKLNRCTIPKLNEISPEISNVCVDIKKRPNAASMIPKNIKTGIDANETPIDGQSGKFEIEDGVIFDGRVIKGTKYFDQRVHLEEAVGKVVVYDGSVYTGLFKNNLLNGPGRIVYPDGAIFQGQFENNELNGKGKAILPNGEIFEGTFANHKLNGPGKISNDFETLTGEFVHNVLVTGEIRNSTGYYAKGSFINMMLEGEGIKQFGDGEKHHGHFTNGLLNGPGKITFSDGTIIEGTFSDGKYHGRMKRTYPDGIIEDAKYVNDKITGILKIIKPDGSIEEIDMSI